MMDQKIEYDFRFKKDSIWFMLTSLAFLAFICSAFFSDQKCVHDFSGKAFDSRCFIFKPCVTLKFNAATYLKAYTTVKRLTKRGRQIL